MYYILIFSIFIISLFIKHIKLIIHILIFITIFIWYTVYFYAIYFRYMDMLFLAKANIFLIKLIGSWMWFWLIIYNGLPFLWFLVAFVYMKVYNKKTIEEATELTLNKEPIAFYIKWLFWVFIWGYKIGQENYKPKVSLFLTPGDVLFYLFWGYLIKALVLLYFN